MSSCYSSLVHIRNKVRVVTNRNTCKKNLVDCCEYVKQRNSVILYKDSPNIKQYTEANKC